MVISDLTRLLLLEHSGDTSSRAPIDRFGFLTCEVVALKPKRFQLTHSSQLFGDGPCTRNAVENTTDNRRQ